LNSQEARAVESVLDKYFTPQKIQEEVQVEPQETVIEEESVQEKKIKKGTKVKKGDLNEIS